LSDEKKLEETEDADVEGHRLQSKTTVNEPDVEGHRLSSDKDEADEGDDVEAHRNVNQRSTN